MSAQLGSKCSRPNCVFAIHSSQAPTNITHCCLACKEKKNPDGSHGPACERIVHAAAYELPHDTKLIKSKMMMGIFLGNPGSKDHAHFFTDLRSPSPLPHAAAAQLAGSSSVNARLGAVDLAGTSVDFFRCTQEWWNAHPGSRFQGKPQIILSSQSNWGTISVS
jgi:hypothetical protein